jgi:hypothetical protein
MTAIFAVLMTGVVWFLGPGRARDEAPGPERERRLPPDEVGVWVGPLDARLRGVLAPVLGDLLPDQVHAAQLNEQLGIVGDRRLGFARLVVANPTDEPRTLALPDGSMRVAVPGGRTAQSLSLRARVESGELSVPGGLAFVLRVLGPLRERIEVPAGGSVALLVPFSEGLDLGSAERVEIADGSVWAPRQSTQAELRRLLASHDAAAMEDLLR